MRAKSIAIFLTVVIALIGVSLFQVDRVLFSDQVAAGEATSRSQMAALIPAFQSEFKSINEHFKFVGQVALVRPVDFSDNISSRFEMIARLAPANGGWAVSEKVFHDKTKIKSWAENYTSIALKSVKPRDLPLGGTALTALLDPQRRPFFLWIMRDEKDAWWAAITKADVFQAIIDRQRGQSASVFLVNKQGQALGHTTAEYLGTILRDNPVVGDIIKTGKRSGMGLYQDAQGNELQGFYELIPGSNVNVVLTRPMTALADSRSSVRWQLLLLGGGLALLGLAALILFVKDPPLNRQASTPGALPIYGAGGAPTPTVTTTTNSVNSSNNSSATLDQKAELVRERSKAYTTAASALAREMQGPLTRILSQAQILKGRSVRDPEIERIEELARDGRNVVLKLLSFAGEEDFKAEPTSINEVLNRTFTLFEPKFQSKGIKLEKNLKRMPEIQAHPLALMKIFEAVLNNAVESMERMPNKTLQIDLDAEGQFAILKIKDSGEGLPADKAAQVFDPFFTTKSPSVHSGLGLATAYGLIREFGGDLKFESMAGQGSTLSMRFPIGVTVPVSTAPTATPYAATAMSTPTTAAPATPLPSLDALGEYTGKIAPPAPPMPKMKSLLRDDKALPLATAPTFGGHDQIATDLNSFSASALESLEGPDLTGPAPMNFARQNPLSDNIETEVPAGGDFDLQLAGDFAPKKPTAPPPAAPQPAAPSMIQDRAIAQTLSMIDDFDGPPKAPVNPRIDPPPVRQTDASGDGKLDRPSFGPKKPPPKTAPPGVQIRRPGERK